MLGYRLSPGQQSRFLLALSFFFSGGCAVTLVGPMQNQVAQNRPLGVLAACLQYSWRFFIARIVALAARFLRSLPNFPSADNAMSDVTRNVRRKCARAS